MFNLKEFARQVIYEDIADPAGTIPTGDHTSLACIPQNAMKAAQLVMKQNGIIAGLIVADEIFRHCDDKLKLEYLKKDGDSVKNGDVIFYVNGNARSILTAERPALNILQRMSGIATLTAEYVEAIKGTKAKILDTRKTTPGLRYLEKEAVMLGGGSNHRFGLFDMILIKDNHIDFAGGIANAIERTRKYLDANSLSLKIEIEVRNFDELREALHTGGVDRIMLDNFKVPDVYKAVEEIAGKFETEVSGNINLNTVRSYAETGVDYISAGALTHSAKALDMSLKSK